MGEAKSHSHLEAPPAPPRPGIDVLFGLCAWLTGWEGLSDWGSHLGEDQRLHVVAGHCRVVEGHVQAPSKPRDALGQVVWGQKGLRGEVTGWDEGRKGWSRLNVYFLIYLFVGFKSCFSSQFEEPPKWLASI